MRWNQGSGIPAALTAALLFGAGTPLAKLLLTETQPWMLAGLLYTGSGCGLWLVRRARGAPPARLSADEWRWLGLAIAAGGVAAPVLLMMGLAAMSAAAAALLLNAESVFTALLAWFVFKENVDRRVAAGLAAIVAGTLVLSWPRDGALDPASVWPTLAVLGACLGWAVDNNLTRKVALSDASWIAMIKGLTAGATNLTLAFVLGAQLPSAANAFGAAAIGFFSYGVSLALFVVALRHLGTARTGAYFSVAPFFGAMLSLALPSEALSPSLVAGGALMALGVYLHVTEEHRHEHTHEALEHEHEHTHDDADHHDHAHAHDHQQENEASALRGARHAHRHRHRALTHTHDHFPDAHHGHTH